MMVQRMYEPCTVMAGDYHELGNLVRHRFVISSPCTGLGLAHTWHLSGTYL
jgi:hypothetical protein